MKVIAGFVATILFLTLASLAHSQQIKTVTSLVSSNTNATKNTLKVVVSRLITARQLQALRLFGKRYKSSILDIEQVDLISKTSVINADVVFGSPSELNYLNRGGLVTTGLGRISPSLIRSLGEAAWGRAICTNTVAAHNSNAQIPETFEDFVQNDKYGRYLVNFADESQFSNQLGIAGFKISDSKSMSSPCELVAEGRRVAAVSHAIDAVTQKARGAPILITPDHNTQQLVPALIKGTTSEDESAALIAEWSYTPDLW